MTIAICMKCGTEKFGGFTPCRACGFRPVAVEELAKSLFLTCHYNERAVLKRIGRGIKDGTYTYDAGQLAPFVAEIERDSAWLEKIQHPERFRPSFVWRVFPWLFGIGLVIFIITMVWRFITHW